MTLKKFKPKKEEPAVKVRHLKEKDKQREADEQIKEYKGKK